MKMPITVIDSDGNPQKVIATIYPGRPADHEPFDPEKYDPEEDTHKMIIQAGWIEEVADE